MVGLIIPPELKKINQFIRRAEEVDNDTTRPALRLVSYYCRQYAVTVGIQYGNTPAAKTCLSLILNEIESDKHAMARFTKYQAESLIRKFANAVFDRADEEDRTGLSNRTTAKTFYAAATFYEVLQQFYKDDQENEEKKKQRNEDVNKRKYSKWRATEILKAMKEGSTVTPGGYGEMEAVKGHMKQQEETEATAPEVVEPSSATTDDALLRLGGNRNVSNSLRDPPNDKDELVESSKSSIPDLAESALRSLTKLLKADEINGSTGKEAMYFFNRGNVHFKNHSNMNEVARGFDCIFQAFDCLRKSTITATSEPEWKNIFECINGLSRSYFILIENDFFEGGNKYASAVALLE